MEIPRQKVKPRKSTCSVIGSVNLEFCQKNLFSPPWKPSTRIFLAFSPVSKEGIYIFFHLPWKMCLSPFPVPKFCEKCNIDTIFSLRLRPFFSSEPFFSAIFRSKGKRSCVIESLRLRHRSMRNIVKSGLIHRRRMGKSPFFGVLFRISFPFSHPLPPLNARNL